MKPTKRDAPKPASPRPASRWMLLGVYLPILVGTVARLAVVNDVRFTGEEALFYSEAHKIANGGALPWYGPRMSGSGYHPGPLFFVISAIPLLVGDDPALVHGWLVLLNMAGVLLLARLTQRLHGPRAAAIAAIMLSSSPWQFVYSIGIWQPHVMLPLFAVVLWCLDRIKRVERSWSWALLVPLLLASFQIHPSCIIVWLMAMTVMVVLRPRIHWKALGLGLAASIAAYLPYLAHEWKSGFENTRKVASDAQTYAWSLTNPVRAFACHFAMTSADINFHIKHGYWDTVPETLSAEWREYWRPDDPALARLGWARPIFAAVSAFTLLLAAGVAAAWLVELARFVRRPIDPGRDVIRLAFVICPVLVFLVVLLGRKPVYPNYVLFVLAAPFFGFVLLDRLVGRVIRSRSEWVVPALAAVLFLPRLGVAVAYVQEVDSRRGLNEQKAFAAWIAERGPLKNVPKLKWHDAWVKEPIPVTLGRCALPELMGRGKSGSDFFSLAAERLVDGAAQQGWLAAQGVRGPVRIVDAAVRPRTTFLQWRRGAE